MLASARIVSSRKQTVRSFLRCFTFSSFIQCAACLEAIDTPAFCSRHLVLVAPARLSANINPARPNEVIRSPIFHCRLVIVGLNAVQRRTLLRCRLLRLGRVHSHVHRKRNVQRGLRPFHHSRVRHFRAEPSTYSDRGPFVNTYCSCCAYAWWLSRRNNVRRRRSSSSMCPTYRFYGRHFRRSSVLRVTLGVPWQSTTSFQ